MAKGESVEVAWIGRNIPLAGRQKLSPWRRQALTAWKSAPDASIHTILDLPAEAMDRYLSQVGGRPTARPLHAAVKAAALALARFPEANCVMRRGGLYRRRDADIFLPVALDAEGHDLAYTVVRQADRKGIGEIAKELVVDVIRLRKHGEKAYRPPNVPLVSGLLIRLATFCLYTLNLWSPAFGVPRNPFGSAAVSDISGFNVDYGFPPLLPIARLPFVIGVGSIIERPNAQGRVEPWQRLTVIFDHRILDGVLVGRICGYLREVWQAPAEHLEAADHLGEAQPQTEPGA